MNLALMTRVVAAVADALLYWLFAETFLLRRQKFSAKDSGMGVAALAAVLLAMRCTLSAPVTEMIVTMGLALCFLLVFYDGTMPRRLTVVFLYSGLLCLLMTGLHYVMVLLVQNIADMGVNTVCWTLFEVSFSRLAALAICCGIRWNAEKNALRMRQGPALLFLCLVATAVIAVLLIFQVIQALEVKSNHSMAAFSAVGLIFSIFFVLFLYAWLARQNEAMRERQQYEQHVNMQIKHLDDILAQQRALRRFKHDIDNQLSTLDGYFLREDCAGGHAYIAALGERFQSISPSIDTGNLALDAILSTKLALMENKGIHCETRLQIPEKLPLDPLDICVIFGNALDHAIEACDRIKEGERRIDFSLVQYDKRMLCQIANTAPDRPAKGIRTAKGDKENHGFGLDNLREALAKYDSVPEITWDDGHFTLDFIIIFS